MSRIVTPALETATGATAEVYAQVKKAAGRVPNAYAAIGAHGPAALGAILQADGVLAAGSLDKQDRETVKLAVSVAAGCDYCVAAHSMMGKMAGLSPETLKRIRAGEPTGDAKRDAARIEAAVEEQVQAVGRANVSRAISDLVRAGLMTRHYAGYATNHKNRGGGRHAVYVVKPSVLALLRKPAPLRRQGPGDALPDGTNEAAIRRGAQSCGISNSSSRPQCPARSGNKRNA